MPLGTDCADNQPLHLNLDRLATHLHVIGPPGSGKTRWLLHLFKNLLHVPGATVILLNPKGAFGQMARDVAILERMASRLVWFDPGDPQAVAGYNPLAPNGLPPSTHAKAVREGLRSAFGQADFDATPQMARLLYLALVLARVNNLGLVEALQILRPGSRIRASILPTVEDPILKEALSYFHGLREARQEELAASAVARLEAFVTDDTIRRILTHSPSLDLASIVRDGRILIANFEIARPLRIDDVKLLGRFLVNDVLNHVFARPRNARHPVFLIMDEAQNFCTTDLCNALDMGRELGLHCVLAHQQLGQLRNEEKSGSLYGSVMGCARTKILFGGLPVEDLEILTKEVMIDQFNPMAIKDERTQLELEPVESTRIVVNRGQARSLSSGTGRGTTKSRSRSQSQALSYQSGKSMGHGSTTTSSSSYGFYDGSGSGETMLPNGEMATSDNNNSGFSDSSSTSESDTTTETRFEAVGAQHGISESEGEAVSETTSVVVNDGESVSVSRVPFHEYQKRQVVTSRTFFSFDEFLTLAMQKIKSQPKAHFLVKTDGSPAIFCRAPHVPDPRISERQREEALAKVFTEPYYLSPSAVAYQLPAGDVKLPNPLPVSADPGDDPWQ